MMIKKVPYTHLALYFLNNIELKADKETEIELLTTSKLANSIE